MPTPMVQAKIWLMIALRGCEKGDSMAQNSRTAAAPW
jgi:hypothetical protein